MISNISLLLEVFPLKERLYFTLFLILSITSRTKFPLSPSTSLLHHTFPQIRANSVPFRKKEG